MNIDHILHRLERVSQTGDGQYIARCPAHEDSTPSLSLSNGGDRVLLHCHAGCSFDAIVDAMGLKPDDLFEKKPQHTSPNTVVATYNYKDQGGQLLYQVVRKEPKAFLQRQPDGNGGWIWNMQDVKRVPYHLPEVVAAETVYICEGEKSTDAIRSLGVTATCNPGGAGKWRADYGRYLADKNIIILPDEDDAGASHASDVSAKLQGIARSVKVVHLPKVTLKSDPADWVGAGGTMEQLEQLVADTEEQGRSPIYWDNDETPKYDDYVRAFEGLGYEFRLNVTNDIVEVNGEPMSDVLRAVIRTRLRDYNYTRVNVAEDAWVAHAADQSYHPVREWLEGLEWDGEDHIAKLATYVESNGLFEVFFQRWLVGAVARAYESTQNRMLVLDGPQGIGKSYFVRWLGSALDRPELFIEGPINPDDKDDKVRVISSWIWEVSELGSTTRRSDRESLKYFLSMQQVTVRKPYGHYDLVKPALSSFIGTVNNISGFLDDPTGYRRFMIAEISGIDWDYADEVDVRQLWAQAKVLYDAGEQWSLSQDEARLAEDASNKYEVEDPLAELINEYYTVTGDKGDFVATTDLLDALHTYGDWRLGSPRAEAMALREAMESHFKATEKARVSVNGKRRAGYRGLRRDF